MGIALSAAGARPALAQDSGTLEGFGGVSIAANDINSPNLGGAITFALTPNVHVIGEVGRLGNVLPPLSDAIFTAADLATVSAFYGEGGVRFVAAPQSAATPYFDATFGVARINISSDRLGTIGNTVLPIAFGMLPRTGPVAGVGAGLLFHTGPIVFDVGYRYKQLYPPSALEAALGLGQQMRSQQLRVGLGVRF